MDREFISWSAPEFPDDLIESPASSTLQQDNLGPWNFRDNEEIGEFLNHQKLKLRNHFTAFSESHPTSHPNTPAKTPISFSPSKISSLPSKLTSLSNTRKRSLHEPNTSTFSPTPPQQKTKPKQLQLEELYKCDDRLLTRYFFLSVKPHTRPLTSSKYNNTITASHPHKYQPQPNLTLTKGFPLDLFRLDLLQKIANQKKNRSASMGNKPRKLYDNFKNQQLGSDKGEQSSNAQRHKVSLIEAISAMNKSNNYDAGYDAIVKAPLKKLVKRNFRSRAMSPAVSKGSLFLNK